MAGNDFCEDIKISWAKLPKICRAVTLSCYRIVGILAKYFKSCPEIRGTLASSIMALSERGTKPNRRCI